MPHRLSAVRESGTEEPFSWGREVRKISILGDVLAESSPVHHRHFHSRLEVQGALGPFLWAGLSGYCLQFFDHIDPDLAPR